MMLSSGGAHGCHLDVCRNCLCMRLSTGAAQYGGCSVGRGSNDYLLSTKRHHSAGDGIPYQPIRSANGSHLVIG